MKNFISFFLIKAVKFSKNYIELSIWLLLFAVGIRFFEAILIGKINNNFSLSLGWNMIGLCYDISLFLRTSVWLLIIFVAICFISEKWARTITRIFFSLMLLLSLICIVFFTTSGFLLDKVVFTYSLKEIMFIIRASNTNSLWVSVIIAALPILYFFLTFIRININNLLLIVFTALLFSTFIFFTSLHPSTDQYHIKANKEQFFLKSILKSKLFQKNRGTKNNELEEFRSLFPEHDFAEIEYPFLYQAKCKDVLSPFFNLKPYPPNFVFIIVEGLGYEFYKNDYHLMPFLESLSKESLTWEFCISTSARTVGVVPALFGALPIVEKGFLAQCPNTPEYNSLLRILNQNHYTHHFFYSGDLEFTGIKCFADQNQFKYIENWDLDIQKESIKPKWGYEDHLLYKQGLRKLNDVSDPRVDVYLTLSTHSPWICPKNSIFHNMVKNKLLQSKTLPEDNKRNPVHIEVYKCFAYADWALQQLLEGYKLRTDYDNTIFIITGDHHHAPIQMGGFYNYHVPLIIYSPMLKSGKNMKGVVSHRDLTPTILSLLINKFNINAPKEVAWLNTALDTSSTFNAHVFSPLQPIDGSLGGIAFKNYLLCENVLEEFIDGSPRRINDPKLLQQMNRLLSIYQSAERHIMYNNALVRNDSAKHKQKQSTVVFVQNDSIAKGSYFAKKLKLPVVEGPEGHKTTLHLNGKNKSSILTLSFESFENKIDRFMIEIEFNIFIINNEQDRYLSLEAELIKDGEVLHSAPLHLSDYMQNRWYACKTMIMCSKEDIPSLDQNCFFKTYIWNPYQLEAFIDDIKIKAIIN